MTHPPVQVAYVALATVPELEGARYEWAQKGAQWISKEFIAALWPATAPGPQFSALIEFPPAEAVFVDPASGALAYYRGARNTDHVGRYRMWRRFWLLNPADAAATRYQLAALRGLADAFDPGESVAQLRSVELELSPDGDRLAALTAGRPAPWLDLWARLAEAVADDALPVAVAARGWPADALADLTEAVALALPLTHRPRWSFATSVCDASVNKARARFMILDAGLRGETLLDPGNLPPLTAERGAGYARFLLDAVHAGWIADIGALLARGDIPSTVRGRELALRLDQRTRGLWSALVTPGKAAEIGSLVRDYPRALTEAALTEAGVWGQLWRADAPVALLPNFAALRGAAPQLAAELDRRLAGLVEERLAALPAAAARLDLLAAALAAYRWPETAAQRLLDLALRPGLPAEQIGKLIALLRAVPNADELAAPLVEQSDGALTGVGLAYAWPNLRPEALAGRNTTARSARVTVRDCPYVVRRPPDPAGDKVYAPARAVADLRVAPALLQMPDPRGGGWLTARPFVKGKNLAEELRAEEKRSAEEKLLAAFGQVAATLDALAAAGLHHGNVKLTNIICGPGGAVLVDEAIGAYAMPATAEDGRRDREDLLRAFFAALSNTGAAVSEELAREANVLAAGHAAAPLIQEVWLMAEREQVRRWMIELLTRDAEVQRALADRASSQPSGWKTELDRQQRLNESQFGDLKARVSNVERQAQSRVGGASSGSVAPVGGASSVEVRELREQVGSLKGSVENLRAELRSYRGGGGLIGEPRRGPSPLATAAAILLPLLLTGLLALVVVPRIVKSQLQAGQPSPVAPAAATATLTPSFTPTARPTFTPTPTVAPPTASPTAQPPAAAGLVTLTAADGQVNIRSGPGQENAVIGTVQPGAVYTAVGRAANDAWVQVDLNDALGWVAAEFVRLSAPLDALPVVDGGPAGAATPPPRGPATSPTPTWTPAG